jgi:hypothetical protein
MLLTGPDLTAAMDTLPVIVEKADPKAETVVAVKV